MIPSKTKTSLILAAGLSLVAMPLSMSAGSAMGHGFRWMDTNKDGNISHAEYVAAASQEFSKLDANQDGEVGFPELTGAEAKVDEMKSKRSGSAMSPGKSGGMMMLRASMGRMSPEQFVRAYDANNDGRVSKAEYVAARVREFTRMDKNKDNSLSMEECSAGMSHSK